MPEQSPNSIGLSRPRTDSPAKVRGQAVFTGDIYLRGLLIGKYLPCPHAHAEILTIDISLAAALPGVHVVVTADDIPDVPAYDPNSRAHAFLARRYAVFAGQPVAAVAADDQATAEAALDLIRVAYRPLAPVVNLREAIETGSPRVSRSPAGRNPGGSWPEDPSIESNIVEKAVYKHGDPQAAFAVSAVIVENTYTVASVHQGYVEPHSAIAWWDQPDHLTIWESVQGAYDARASLAATLGLPHTSITLNAVEIGGGFGGKNLGLCAPLAALLSRKAGKPVRLVLTRQEDLTAANPAPHSIIHIKTGATQQGMLTALEAEVLVEAGAFTSGWIMSSICSLLKNTYHFDAWNINGLEVLTNKPSISAYRAPGAPNAAFAIESQVDELARRLGIDPLEFRMANLSLEGDLQANLDPQPPVGTRQVLQAVARHPAWFNPIPPRTGADGLLRGRGLALGFWEGGAGPASAIAFLEADGRFRIVLGTVDLTGSYTSMAQIAAQTLGVSPERVLLTKASPDQAPYAPVSAGSQTVYAMGAAVELAVADLREKIIASAALALETNPEFIHLDDLGAHIAFKPQLCINYEEIYRLGTEWSATSGPLVGVGSAPVRRRAPGTAACIAEVAIDPDTGNVLVTRLVVVQDVGKAINPLLVEGQMQGGVAQSVSMALWEGFSYGADGLLLNPTLLDYRMPTALDLPAIETVLVEAPGGDGPYGAKIVGEPAIVPPIAAIANAIASATGRRVCEAPITPEHIWRLLNL